MKLKLGNTKEALKDVNKSLKIKEFNAYAYKNRALIYIELGQNENACLDLKQAIDYGYSQQYGDEVKELIKTNCIK